MMHKLARGAVIGLSLAASAVIFSGCESSYSVDIRNQTSQPLYANIVERTEGGGFNRATMRLGPGDRGAIGPVSMRTGRAMLVVDTKGNPTGPAQLDLPPGTSVVRIEQDNDSSSSPIHLRDITK
jgi:hypothetical protein